MQRIQTHPCIFDRGIKNLVTVPIGKQHYKAISIILDSESYKFLDNDINYGKVKVIVEHIKDLLYASNCHIDHLKEELEIFFDHI